jgi:hypothetical protein
MILKISVSLKSIAQYILFSSKHKTEVSVIEYLLYERKKNSFIQFTSLGRLKRCRLEELGMFLGLFPLFYT